ncbi:MAG: non-homologous end-joining DNA ligase [Nocardioides sp.]
MRPMLATAGTHVPQGEDWVHEVKWDGIRLLAEVSSSRVRLTTRNENDATIAWPELLEGQLEHLPRDLVVDGEVIALNERGLPDFRVLGERMHSRDPRKAARHAVAHPATFMVFDVVRLDGADLTGLSWTDRRAILERLAADGALGRWQVPPTYDDGAMLHAATLAQGLEGIVSKRTASKYEPGVRSKAWLKFPHRFRASYVVGGWRPQEGTTVSQGRLASLLVGEVTPDGLLYRGRVGSGITARLSTLLRELLTPAASSPFADEVPREDVKGTQWTEPLLVVEVETHGLGTGLASGGRLRQPSFQGVRADLTPADLA